MKLSNSWKGFCFKTKYRLPQTSLTFLNRIASCRGKEGERGREGDGEKSPEPFQKTCDNQLPFLPLKAQVFKRVSITVGLSLLLLSGSMTKGSAQSRVLRTGLGDKRDTSVGSYSGLMKPLAPELQAQSLPVLTPTQPAAVEQLKQGIALIQQGKLPEAIAAFRQASQLNPQLAPAHYNLGLALRQVGQLQASADAFYKATQADPNFALAFANLGAALLEGSNLQLARDYLGRALELDSNLGVAHYNYGLVLSQLGELDGAIAQFKSAMQLSQNAPEPSYHLGVTYLQQGKIKEAKKAFQQALKISPQYPEAHYHIGSILFNEGNLDAALEAFRKSAVANSNYANAYYAAGLVFLRQNRYSDAQQVLQYARDLYKVQGNSQWARQADQLLERSR